MWVYRHTDTAYDDEGGVHHTYTTGFYGPGGLWHADEDFATKGDAVRRVHYLNGGTPESEP